MFRRLFFLTCFIWSAAFAQPLTPYTFAHYAMSNGLLSNEVRSVVQDRTGYLWIATNNGLQRYDGIHYKNFQHRDNDPFSLPVNFILQVVIDNADNLWLLTANGEVGLFDKRHFTYTSVPVKVQRTNSLWAIKALVKDNEGNLFYLLHGNELLRYDTTQKAFVPATDFFHLKPEWKITGLAQQPGTRKYWLGLASGGVVVVNRQSGRNSYAGNNVEKEAGVDSLQRFPSMSHFLFDSKGRLWAESWDQGYFPHVVLFEPGKSGRKVRLFEFISTLKTYNEVHGFAEQKDGRIWVYGTVVFAQYNENDNKFDLIGSDSQSGLGIVYDRITGLYEDREKNVWIATGNNGLYRCNPSQQYFRNVFHLNKHTGGPGQGSIMSFVELNNGDVLAGSWGDGIFRYNKQWKEVPLNFRDDALHGWASVWNMCASSDSNTIWMACQPGIFQLDQAKGVMTYRNPSILQNKTVRQIAEDRQGNLWLGMQRFGLFKWIAPRKTGRDSLVKISQLGDEHISRVVTDPKGYVWVTSEKKGVYAFESETGQVRFQWNNRNEADSEKIVEGFSSVLPFDDSLVYVSTATRLYVFNRYTNQIRQQQLPGAVLGSIASLAKDGDGFLWISTDNGIFRFLPSRNTMVFFNREDGIANDRFIMAASYRMRNGRMLFGTDNSFIHFNPTEVKFSTHPQKVVLTSVQVGRRELPVDSVLKLDRLRLGATENSLIVDFSSLTYTASGLIQYKLEGLDQEWRTAEKDNNASFPFLPPGRYTLLLRTITAEGETSPVTALPIYINAPFYQTWWFYTLLAVAVALLLFWLDRQRSMKKQALEKVRTDIAGGLHQEVNTALNNINILSEIARLKSEREPQKAKDYLEQIHNKSHNMIIALDDMLWSLDPENDAMDKTIQRMREFCDSLMQRNGVVIELLIDRKVERLQLNMKTRHEAFLLFKEGLRSLVDAGTRSCIVHLTTERGKLLLTIEFENDCCNMQKLNNLLQRRDLELRLNDLKAKVDVQVHKSRSVFLLQLPL